MKVSLNGFAEALMDVIGEEVDRLDGNLTVIVEETAQEVKQALKDTSPVGTGDDNGHYKDGWSVRAKKDGRGKTVYNKLKPKLTHLIEHGSVERYTRTKKTTGIMPDTKAHIRTVHDEYADKFLQKLKNV